MNNTTILNFQFICKYIASFGIIFYNKGLIKIDQRYQIVPVFNAFFQYLNQSSNATEAKIQLLLEINNNTDFYQNNLNKGILYKENIFKENFVKTNLDEKNLIQVNFYKKENACNLEHLNEIYQCIINVTLFSHYGGVNGYLSKIVNKMENKSISALRKILHLDLTYNYMINDICSSGNTTEFTSLTIEKMFEYIWPLFIKLHATRKRFNDVQKKGSRNKRTPITTDDLKEVQDEKYLTLPSKIPKTRETILLFSSDSSKSLSSIFELERILKVFKKNPDCYIETIFEECRDNEIIITGEDDIFKKFKLHANYLAIEQIDVEWLMSPIQLWRSQKTNRKIFDLLQNHSGDFFFNDITLLEKLESNKLFLTLRKPIHYDTDLRLYTVFYFITINSPHGFVNLEDTENFKNITIAFPDVRFNVINTEIDEKSKILRIYLSNNYLQKEEWKSNRIKELSVLNTPQREKNKRMKSIEKAAYIITKDVPMFTFEMSVDLLKNYTLKLEESKIPIPTYNEFAIDFCNNLAIRAIYNSWQIPRHKLIDDVLFNENLNYSKSYNDFEKKIKKILPQYAKSAIIEAYDEYQKFHEIKYSYRLEDYLLLREALRKENKNFRAHMFRRVEVALYRLALRQSNEEWADYDIRLYRAKYAGNTNPLYRKFEKESSYTFDDLVEFSPNYLDEQSKFPITNGSRGDYVWMEIKFKNQVGIVNISRLYNKNFIEKYIIPPPRTLPVEVVEFEVKENKKVMIIKMVDKESKERKIVDLADKLHQILLDFPELEEYYFE